MKIQVKNPLVKKLFSINVSAMQVPVADGSKQSTNYVISTDGLVNQVIDNCESDELLMLNSITPLSCFTQVTGKSELELLAELSCKVAESKMTVEYYNRESKTGISVIFHDKMSAAVLVKLIADNLDPIYKYDSK